MDEKQAYIVNRLKNFLVDHYSPELIILYGSTARGDTDEFSDIDIMVIMDVEESEKISNEIIAATDHIVQDKHILIRSTADYINQKDIPGTMVFSALIEGKKLYQKPGFNAETLPEKSYYNRKKDVIEKEYLGQGSDFMKTAERALSTKQLFRCRDYMRFAVVRILKAVMVFDDVHPPRSTDLQELFEMVQELMPEIKEYQTIIIELNNYCPGGDDYEEVEVCRSFFDKIRLVIYKIELHLK